MQETKYLSVKEVAKRLGDSHERTVYRYIKSGMLDAVRLRRRLLISEESFHKLVQNQTVAEGK